MEGYNWYIIAYLYLRLLQRAGEFAEAGLPLPQDLADQIKAEVSTPHAGELKRHFGHVRGEADVQHLRKHVKS